MKRLIFSFLFLQFFYACSNDDRKAAQASENDIDAARNFIRAALDGQWTEARKFLVPDTVNTQLLDTYEENYQTSMSREDKRGYREASITTYDPRKVNDSVVIINYSNSYMKKRDSLKVVRMNGKWLIDLKYSYFHLSDSVNNAQ